MIAQLPPFRILHQR